MLTFFLGFGAGVTVFTFGIIVAIGWRNRLTQEQRTMNQQTHETMLEGNRLRERRAVAMERIANVMEADRSDRTSAKQPA